MVQHDLKNARMYSIVDEKNSKDFSLDKTLDFYTRVYKSQEERDPNTVLVSDREFENSVEINGLKLIPVKYINPSVLYFGILE